MPNRIDRVAIKPPKGFDSRSRKHVAWLTQKVTEANGDGFTMTQVSEGSVVFERVFEMVADVGDVNQQGVRPVKLNRAYKASEGDSLAADLERQNPGWTMTMFDPFGKRAELRKLTAEENTLRAAVASSMTLKPWEVQVHTLTKGGYEIVFPEGRYRRSMHDSRLEEIAVTVAGTDGWYIDPHPEASTVLMLPGNPPMFPRSIPAPPITEIIPYNPNAVDKHTKRGWQFVPIGKKLGTPSQPEGETFYLDFLETPSIQISGTAGSGKGGFLMSLIGNAIPRGWDLALLDPSKECVDYIDFQPFVHKNYWGDNFVNTLTILEMICEEGERRKQLIKKNRVQKFVQLPLELGVKPLMVIIDEATQLFNIPKVPPGLPKDSPVRASIEERVYVSSQTLELATRIPRLYRFAGISLVMASQVASTNTGIPTEIRTLMQGKILLGSKANQGNRKLALNSPDEVPEVPIQVAEDPNGGGMGSGVFELQGQTPGVFKAYFDNPDVIAKRLHKLGCPTIDEADAEPTSKQVYKYVTSKLEGDGDDDDAPAPSRKPSGGERGPSGRSAEQIARDMGDPEAGHGGAMIDPETGKPLDSFQRANAVRHASANPGAMTAKEKAGIPRVIDSSTTQAVPCPSCENGFINPSTQTCVKCGARAF